MSLVVKTKGREAMAGQRTTLIKAWMIKSDAFIETNRNQVIQHNGKAASQLLEDLSCTI